MQHQSTRSLLAALALGLAAALALPIGTALPVQAAEPAFRLDAALAVDALGLTGPETSVPVPASGVVEGVLAVALEEGATADGLALASISVLHAGAPV